MSLALKPNTGATPPGTKRPLAASPGTFLIWGSMAVFLLLLLGVVSSVVVNSFAKEWFDTWLPSGYTTSWYAEAWKEYDLGQVIGTTLTVSVAVVGISVLIGAPAS